MAESGALCWGSNPYESSHKNYTKTTSKTGVYRAALESGLDNSPMYDNIPFDNRKHTYKLEDVGLTGMYILDCRSLIELAEILRRREDAVELARRKEMAETGLMGLWDDEKGFFFNRRTDTGQFDRHISPCQFYALFSDQVTWRQVSRIIGEHYYNPLEFYGDWLLPSISRDDPAFTDQNYWRGRVWAPLNFLTYLAFLHHDLPDARHDLACKSRDILMKEWREHRHIHVNYNAMTGEGCDAKNSDRFLPLERAAGRHLDAGRRVYRRVREQTSISARYAVFTRNPCANSETGWDRDEKGRWTERKYPQAE
jgi:hypothetical protein